ncbi:SpoIIE family protein phosphatase [Streptomyces sp. JB150]|uniref:PP2C family protein-serine/threonine phosphatase n=1 Tax=Streptomyces sp. JB150 TaxID=2714844 RepID=UPI00140E1FAF|nr:SpoIIE family protein phosphatase [Streptomyces sp. JB150]QIJ60768.1 SpoIIE family protein phosphatase [Streptomyces sp. JB150]
MTACPDAWKISTAVDAARVRALAARLAARAGLPVLEQARSLSALTAQLRRCLAGGETWDVLVERRPPAGDTDGTVRIAVRPAGHPPQERPPWELTVPWHEPAAPSGAAAPCDPAALDEAALAEALLAADDSTAHVLSSLDEQEELVRFHREELHHTNQGVLALHAELDAAARGQRATLDAERAARAEAERARRLLTFLADASAAVTASLDHEDIVKRLSGLLVPDYAAHVDVWLFDDDTAPPVRARPAAAVTAARTGRPQHAAAHPGGLPDVDDLPPSALAPDRPLLCIPLMSRSVQGVLSLTSSGSRFDADTTVMLIELARRAAIALDNARRYEQHRDTAEALQRAQLTDLPITEGVRLAARYLPATHGLNIGGDWYDAFVQPDGSLLAVIGDVTGHGLHAAMMMGQLRTALRAYAVEDDSPARILTRLHRMLCHQQPSLYATALVARFHPDDPRVVWAAAGHPPAVARSPEGTVRLLDARPGVMLGVPLPFTYEDHSAELPPGSTLALYTDGLVERRARGIDPGIERLAQTLAAVSPAELEDLEAATESILKPMLHDSERDDDVCLLLCHRVAEPEAARTRQRGAG